MQVLARQLAGERPAVPARVEPAFEIRRLHTFVDERMSPSSAQAGAAFRTIAVAVTIANPHASLYADEIDDLFAIGGSLGRLLGRKIAAATLDLEISAIGKAALVGWAGELEHAVGLTGASFDASALQSLRLTCSAIASERRLVKLGADLHVRLGAAESAATGGLAREIALRFADGPAEDEVIVVLAVAGAARG